MKHLYYFWFAAYALTITKRKRVVNNYYSYNEMHMFNDLIKQFSVLFFN